MVVIEGRALNKLGGHTGLPNLIKLRMSIKYSITDRLWALRFIVERETAQIVI